MSTENLPNSAEADSGGFRLLYVRALFPGKGDHPALAELE